MKGRRAVALLGFTILPLAGLGMSGCGETGPQGPPGPSALQSCFACHGDTPGDEISIAEITTEYELSKHYLGDTFQRKDTPCSGCHTNEGFLERVASGSFPPAALEHSSRIACWTCHAPHTNGNFSLRTNMPVALLDGSGEFDHGKGNLCANCHQSREANPPVPDPGSTVAVTSNRWGPHNATQANIFTASGGYVCDTDTTCVPSTDGDARTSIHSQLVGDACFTCHMSALPSSGTAGGHTWAMRYESRGALQPNLTACNTASCHGEGGLSDFDHSMRQTQTTALLDLVRTRLMNNGLIDATDHIVPGTYTREQTAAVWNFLMVLEDGSLGVHNFKYGEDLLNAALEFVPPAAPRVAKE